MGDLIFAPQRFQIPETDHPIPNGFQEARPLFVMRYLPWLGVRFAVEFDNQLRAMACEIGIVGSDRRLPPEMQPLVPQQAKRFPQSLFGLGGILT
ncbi:MAG TPA: hypothetical protein VLC74_07405 [Rhizomicrobium sp.]|nr:hypothetical protein [Rhizomicrobium sp.]